MRILILILTIISFLVRCSISPVAGGTTDTGNAIVVTGAIVDSLGKAAEDVQVYLLPNEFNPLEDTISPAHLDTTNSKGTYSFTIKDTGTYNVFAVDLKERTNLLVPHISVPLDTTTVSIDTVKATGSIKIYLPDDVDTANGYLFIRGTLIYKELSKAQNLGGNGFLLQLDSVPEASISSILYDKLNIPTDPTSINTDTLEVIPTDTVETHAFIKWVQYTKEDLILLDNKIFDIMILSDNVKWFASNYGLLTLNNGHWKQRISNNSSIPSNVVHRVLRDHRDMIWVATDRGVALSDDDHYLIYDIHTARLPSNFVTDVAIDSSGDIWLAMHGGMAKFKYWDSTFVIYDENNTTLPSYMANAVAVDKMNSIWFGTDVGALSFNRSTWTSYDASNSALPTDTIYCVSVDKKGNVWYGFSGGVAYFDGFSWNKFTKSDSPILGNEVKTIFIDNNDVWIGTSGGLTRFDGTKWRDYTGAVYRLLENLHILSIAKDTEQNIWIGTFDKGIIGFGPKIKSYMHK